MNKRFFVYVILIVALSPFVQFLFSIGMYSPDNHGGFPISLSLVFLSGPILLFIGILLVRDKGIHRFIGGASVAIAIIWMFFVFRDIFAEIRIL